MERADRHIHFALVGAAGFALVVTANWALGHCWACDVQADILAVARVGVAGGVTGWIVSLTYDVARSRGRLGEYTLGVLATWGALVITEALRPEVQVSFFVGFGGAWSVWRLLLPALVIGTVATFEVRRRTARKAAAPSAGASLGDARPLWLKPSRLGRDIAVVALAVMLGWWADDRLWSSVEAETTDAVVAHNRSMAAQYPDDPTSHLYLAMSLLAIQEWEEARQSAGRAIDLDANGAAQHSALGWAHIGLGQPEQAVEPFETAASLSPEDVTLWRDLGRLALMVGDSALALSAYEEVKALSPQPSLWERQDREAWQRLSARVRPPVRR